MTKRQTNQEPASLEVDTASIEAAVSHAVARGTAELATQEQRPVAPDTVGGEPLLPTGVPHGGRPLTELIDAVFDRGLPGSFNAASAGYLAYVPGGGLFPAALADLIANMTNRYTGLRIAAPSLVDIEAEVLRWFTEWLGMPDTTRGLVTTGGSMAMFSAIVTAREKHLGTRLRDGVLYVSDQAHHCVAKSARMAGILEDRVRVLAADDHQRLSESTLAAAVERDLKAGLIPFMVVTSAGTTNTGDIDPLESVGNYCRSKGLWHHVDGAYGGFFVLCRQLRGSLAGIESADSVTLDPHKGLFLPYGTGALLVRDGQALKAAHQMGASYLPDAAEHYSPADYGPELTRDFRALRIWFCLQHFGVDHFRLNLLEKHQLAVRAAEALARDLRIEVLRQPALSLFAFRVSEAVCRGDATRRNNQTQALVERVNAKGRVMLSGTWVGDDYWARICVLCFRTHQEHIDWAIDDIVTSAQEIAGQPQ